MSRYFTWSLVISAGLLAATLLAGCNGEAPADSSSDEQNGQAEQSGDSGSQASAGDNGTNGNGERRPKPMPEMDPNEFPASWFSGNAQTRARHQELVGYLPPELPMTDWMSEQVDIEEDLYGKVVVVIFWGSWCPHCRNAMPTNKALYEKYKDDGLAIIGVHDPRRGIDQYPNLVNQHDLQYYNGVAASPRVLSSWRIAAWPTYFVIDRWNRLRAAGVRPDRVEDVVTPLLEESFY